MSEATPKTPARVTNTVKRVLRAAGIEPMRVSTIRINNGRDLYTVVQFDRRDAGLATRAWAVLVRYPDARAVFDGGRAAFVSVTQDAVPAVLLADLKVGDVVRDVEGIERTVRNKLGGNNGAAVVRFTDGHTMAGVEWLGATVTHAEPF